MEWNPTPAQLNDPTFRLRCEYDRPFQGSTPDKSLAIRLIAPEMWRTDYDDLQKGDAAQIATQDVGLESVAVIGAGDPMTEQLPLTCKSTLPCVISKTGDEWLTLTMIMPDRSAMQLEINPRNVDFAKQLAQKIVGKLPLKR